MSEIVLLDNEAVQALRNPAHRKHRRVMVYVLEAARDTTRAVPVSVAVPTTVRVEAGWDRRSPSWAFVNQLHILDISLGPELADSAAAIRKRTGVSVADAHLGAAIQMTGLKHVTVITSDPRDMRAVAEGKPIEIVAL